MMRSCTTTRSGFADADAKAYQRFVEDLKIAADLLAKIGARSPNFQQSGSRNFW